WIIGQAEGALQLRGNRDGAHALRQQGIIYESEELRAWNRAAEDWAEGPPLKLDFFAEGESFRYLSEEELFERICSDPRIRRTIAEYHQAVFHDDLYFGLFQGLKGIRSSQEEKHMSWLIAYIASAPDGTDRDIADKEGADENTVKWGRKAFA